MSEVEGKYMKIVCVAGKNNIAVEVLEYLEKITMGDMKCA